LFRESHLDHFVGRGDLLDRVGAAH
jgi:hypothetical protein